LKIRLTTAALAALLCASCASSSDSKVTAADYAPDKAMPKWMAYMTPGPSHKVLDSKVGTWNLKVTMYNPDGSVQTSDGTSEIAWVMDGRYLQEKVNGSFEGMNFQGNGTTAFDNLKKKYVYTWFDNMGTGIMTGEGLYDPAHRTFTYYGESPDVVKGQYVSSRSVETQVDNNHWRMEAFGLGPDGKEMKMMEIVYTRRT